MKFSEMKYSRPSLEEMKNTVKSLTEELRTAESYEEAKAVFLKEQKATSIAGVPYTYEMLKMLRAVETREPPSGMKM